MTEPTYRPEDLDARRQKERKVWRAAFVVSLALHILLVLLGPRTPLPESPFAAAGPQDRDDRAADGAIQTLALRAAPPDAAVPVAIPVPDLELPEIEEIEPEATPEVEPEPPELPEPPATGATSGSDPDDSPDPAGIPGATGQGDGGTVDEGRFRVVPPTPRGMIIPPTNRNLRGRQVQVWVFVDERGRVVSDSTRLEPPTSDRRFNEQLIREASEWVFTPARREGEAVGAWFPYVISM